MRSTVRRLRNRAKKKKLRCGRSGPLRERSTRLTSPRSVKFRTPNKRSILGAAYAQLLRNSRRDNSRTARSVHQKKAAQVLGGLTRWRIQDTARRQRPKTYIRF